MSHKEQANEKENGVDPISTTEINSTKTICSASTAHAARVLHLIFDSDKLVNIHIVHGYQSGKYVIRIYWLHNFQCARHATPRMSPTYTHLHANDERKAIILITYPSLLCIHWNSPGNDVNKIAYTIKRHTAYCLQFGELFLFFFRIPSLGIISIHPSRPE